MTSSYSARVLEQVETGRGTWPFLRVGVFDGEQQIGEYNRNYPTLYRTFCPFQVDGQDLAFYAPDYTATRILQLPTCKDLGGEPRDTYGFCPVDFYVPAVAQGHWGLVAGCIWGDDTSYKVEYLDLSRAAEGIIRREAKFGYLELSSCVATLADAINLDWYDPEDDMDVIEIAAATRWSLATGQYRGAPIGHPEQSA